MSNEELAVLIQRGDSEKMALLWEQIERFVAFRANRIITLSGDRIKVEFDDLYNSGYLALVKAVETFDAEKGFSFSTWFGYHLRTIFAETAGYRNKAKFRVECSTVSFETPIGEDDSTTIGDTVADNSNVEDTVVESVTQQELHDLLERAMGDLLPLEEQVLRQLYYEENTLEAVGVAHGLPKERIRQLKGNALCKIRCGPVRKKLEQYIDRRTNWYVSYSVHSQRSPVEETVLWREELRMRCQPKRKSSVDDLLEKYLTPEMLEQYNDRLERHLDELLEAQK